MYYTQRQALQCNGLSAQISQKSRKAARWSRARFFGWGNLRL